MISVLSISTLWLGTFIIGFSPSIGPTIAGRFVLHQMKNRRESLWLSRLLLFHSLLLSLLCSCVHPLCNALTMLLRNYSCLHRWRAAVSSTIHDYRYHHAKGYQCNIFNPDYLPPGKLGFGRPSVLRPIRRRSQAWNTTDWTAIYHCGWIGSPVVGAIVARTAPTPWAKFFA